MSARSVTVDRMKVDIFSDVGELAAAAAAVAAATISAAIEARGRANVMFASGNSQLEVLGALATHQEIHWERVTGFHMDEYVGVGIDHPAGFARYMRVHVEAVMRPGTFHSIDGRAADPDAEAARYAALLATHPLDLCLLGIGENGHLAFNDPPVADFEDPQAVKVVALDDACKRQQVGEGHFESVDAVPPRAITVTIPALLAATVVLAIVPEARKAAPVRAALEGPVSTACPASILRTRTNTHLFLDHASAAQLEHG